MKHLLSRRYWQFTDGVTHVERIEAEFKSEGMNISDSGHGTIFINVNGMKKLYKLLKKRFPKL